MKHNIVAVIACHGRLPLLRRTIDRLYQKNGVRAVICVGGDAEEFTCKQAGAFFVRHENRPLGKKWNAGFLRAQKFNPEAVLFVGSSDWLSDNWLNVAMPFVNEYDIIGKTDFYMLDVPKEGSIRSAFWVGYGAGARENEPIGIGRVVSARMMDKMNWQPFDDNRNNSMDWMMYQKTLQLGGAVKLIEGSEIKSLSISTDAWPNMHKFEDHWNDKVPSKSVRLSPEWVNDEFPEYKLIFK